MKRIFIFLAILLTSVTCYGQAKWELSCPPELLNRSRANAEAQVGVKEQTGNNDGAMVRKYQQSVGLPSGSAYCAAGQYWCFQEAAKQLKIPYTKIPIKKTGLANGMYADAAKHGKRVAYQPRVDDLLVWRKGKTINGHIERIVKVLGNGWVVTVGFNTSSGKAGSQDNGQGVYYRKRNVNFPLSRILFVRGLIGFNNVT